MVVVDVAAHADHHGDGVVGEGDDYRLTVRNPPLVRPFTVDVSLDGTMLYVPFTTAGITELQPR